MAFWIVPLLLFAGMLLSVLSGKLTPLAAITGGFIGYCLFLCAGYAALGMLAAFFLMGTLATSWKIGMKRAQGLAEAHGGRRTVGQVVANSGVPGLLGLLGWIYPEYRSLVSVMIAAAFASASADTLSSELGNIYGSDFFNMISLKRDKKGLDGVVSLEGTLFGIAGAIIISVIYGIGFGWNKNILIIILAGTIGNIFDSVIGASLERKKYVGNNTVNFLNTFIAAACALLFV